MDSKQTKKVKKPFTVMPSLYAACVELSGGSTSAGGLLCQIAIRSDTNTLKDEKGRDGWLVLSSHQWRYVTGFSRHQYNDAIKLLKDMGLIEHRRRRLNYQSPAALVWIKISDNVKAGITEITSRAAISAFEEIPQITVSANSDKPALPFTEETELLNEMIIIKNDNYSKNDDVVGKTTLESISDIEEKETLEEKGKKKKKVKKQSINKKDWFNITMKEIYENSNFSPEPFQDSSAKILLDAKEYLESNTGGFFEFCTVENQSFEYALSEVIENWGDFSWFATERFSGYKISPVPQLWSIKHQLKAIPDFIKYRAYVKNIRAILIAEEINPPNDFDSIYGIKHFQEYVDLHLEKRKGFLNKIVMNTYYSIEKNNIEQNIKFNKLLSS